ncbi:restriction endonuclease subunit S [Eubacterium sp.]|uniref:restriction endonuclease subunit S n=1 Tax=Eubacterium sp. TaxID=142586 RepID=UPI0025DEC908|nr:restriction endonuclease subunit S [Eubacterium sp.]MCR5628141.1 restriction endonuclease subunit S [Eubacterium sp.]
MVWNSQINRFIPENWSVCTIGDISKRVKVGFVGPVDAYYCDEDEGIPIIRPSEMSINGINYSNLRFITREFYNKNKKSQIHKGDVLISRCGKDGIPNIYDRDSNAQVLNAVIIEPDDAKATSNVLCTLLKSEYSQVQLKNSTSGSVQGVINTKNIADIMCVYNKEVFKSFGKIIACNYNKQRVLRIENDKLAFLKDWLLPMLMNGQAAIAD